MTETTVRRYAIVGGGLLGMTLALRLRQQGHAVSLYERSPKLGGLAGAWQLGDVVWDRHYHVILMSDSYLRSVLRELDLDQQVKWVETKTGFYTDGKFHSMSSSLEFLRFPPLGLVSKARLAWTIFYASRIKNWRPLENIPVADWLRRWSGTKTFEKIWLPLLRSKLGESYHKTSAAFIWATIQRMYAARRSGLKKEMFGYVPGGYGRILEAFKVRLEKAGVDLILGAKVESVTAKSGAVVALRLADGTEAEFDQAVLTIPSAIAVQICPDLTAHEKELLLGTEYQGIVCASLLLNRPLGGYYITNITDSWVPYTAVIEMSAFVDRGQFGGKSLVYLPKYLASDDSSFEIPDDEWERRFVEALTRMYPDLQESDVLSFKVSRERFVYALPTLGYSSRLAPQRTSVHGVSIVNSTHIVNGTLNVNETIRLAEESLPNLLTDVAGSPRTTGGESEARP